MALSRSRGDALGASYRLDERLGSGAVGEVWRVEVTATGARLAAKLLREEHAHDPGVVERFVRERTVLLSLDHPSIVRTRDLVIEGSQLAIVMDLVTGGSGRDLLQTSGPLSARDALALVADMLDALTAAHSAGVIHRDVKPDNILLSEPWRPGGTGTVRVADFGIASVLADRDGQTTGLLGTPQYMAPESISQGRAEAPADVYGAGVTLYEFLAGRTPFAGPGTDFTIAYRHVTASVPPLDLPSPLWAAVQTMLAKDPAARPTAASAAALLRQLAAQFADLPALATVDTPDGFLEVERPATVVRGFASAAGALSDVGGPNTEADSFGTDQVFGPAPDLGVPGSATVVRPLSPSRPQAPVVEPETPRSRFTVPDWLTGRVAVLGSTGIVLGAVIVGAVLWLPRSANRTPAADAPASTTAFQQDRALPTGLSVTRKATLDAAAGHIVLTLTYSAQAAPLGGELLEIVPGLTASDDCPHVAWTGEGVTGGPNRPSISGVDARCGRTLSRVTIPANGQLAVTGTVSIEPSELSSVTQNGLDEWLQRGASATAASIDDTSVTGPAYAAQRLQGVRVVTPARAVSQTTLPVTLVPVWPSGPDELDPLYRSPSTGASSQLLADIAGGEKGVQFADACSGALAVSAGGLVVTALSVAPSCTVRADVGNFTGLTSDAFGITTRQ